MLTANEPQSYKFTRTKNTCKRVFLSGNQSLSHIIDQWISYIDDPNCCGTVNGNQGKVVCVVCLWCIENGFHKVYILRDSSRICGFPPTFSALI